MAPTKKAVAVEAPTKKASTAAATAKGKGTRAAVAHEETGTEKKKKKGKEEKKAGPLKTPGRGAAAAAPTPAAVRPKKALAPLLSTIGGYVVVPVYTAANEAFLHYLYFKKHDSRKDDDSLPAGRTLFVTNVPPTAKRTAFERLFAECGVIESVQFGVLHEQTAPQSLDEYVQTAVLPPSETPGTAARDGGHAFVVFAEAAAVEAALRMRHAERHMVDDDDASAAADNFGLAHSLRRYRQLRINPAAMQERVDQFMQAFESAEAQRKRKLAASEAAPDADGFIPVTRRAKRGRTGDDRTGVKVTAAKSSVAKARAEVTAAKKKPLVDFYRFQMRQAKREQIADLRRKFEEDKLRIERMKAARKFRPY